MLKSWGWIILTTPNIIPINRFLFLLGKLFQGYAVEEFRKLDKLGYLDHIHLYTFNDVKRFLEYVGFEIEFHRFKVKLDIVRGKESKVSFFD